MNTYRHMYYMPIQSLSDRLCHICSWNNILTNLGTLIKSLILWRSQSKCHYVIKKYMRYICFRTKHFVNIYAAHLHLCYPNPFICAQIKNEKAKEIHKDAGDKTITNMNFKDMRSKGKNYCGLSMWGIERRNVSLSVKLY